MFIINTLAPQLTNIQDVNIRKYKRELARVYLFYIGIYWILYRDFLCVITAGNSSASVSSNNKKRKASYHSASDRKRQAISMETKVASQKKLGRGEKMPNAILLLLLFLLVFVFFSIFILI